MNILDSVNIITVLMICIFALPVLVGLIMPLTRDRTYRSLASLLSSVLLIAAIIFAVYLTKVILSGYGDVILSKLYNIFPSFQYAAVNKDIIVYAVLVLVITLIIYGLLHLIMLPVFRFVLVPLSNRISDAISTMNSFFRHIIGGLWKIPKAVWLVLVFSLLLNFYTGLQSSSVITEYANTSVPYQYINENVLKPLLSNSTVKNIQVLLNDSFKAAEDEISSLAGKGQLTRYINGVTLDEAVKSDTEIDAAALKTVGAEKNSRKKAYLIYEWICKNIKYDDSKAAAIVNDPSSVSSGAIVAYNTRKGICFDYACLYVAMCRAVGLKVRFITGLGYTGTDWGDHAWNQVYCPEENAWINADTTFGSSGADFFGTPDFDLYHTDAVIQEEW